MKNIRYLALVCLSLFSCIANVNAETTQLHQTPLPHDFVSLLWAIPFVGILLSIALLPVLLPQIWHNHYGKIVSCWTLLFLGATLIVFDLNFTVQITLHAMVSEYLPFILLLLALFTVSGGILIDCHLQDTPKNNLCLLAIGTLLASIMGTTGAAMLMIRPLIRINYRRQQRIHIMIFFIFLIANIGGGLTPLGDPPLFIGFLKGVDFFWTLKQMLLPVIVNTVVLLGIFYWIDSVLYRKEATNRIDFDNATAHTSPRLQIQGIKNGLLLIVILLAVLLSGVWQSDIAITFFDITVTLPNLLRDLLFIAIIMISLRTTAKSIYIANQFNWAPIIEVSKLFVAIFITITPILTLLRAGSDGALAPLISLVSNAQGEPINAFYFWLSGLLSGFLDNAPTYLVFFNLAAGDATTLTQQLPNTLLAISMGSVFMGALTYIGNAPNLMVKSIAIQNQITMPSFFGYMQWSLILLIPLFLIDMMLFLI
ncbi:sodium:proton antiporter [Orbaceae bacterium ESL0727]|nr:sodium:proton antiporter [Orbaceae bacterium ESL0727]